MRIFGKRTLATILVVALAALVLAQEGESDEERAMRLIEELQAAPYTEWAFEPGVPEGYYVGTEPHGLILRTYINDVVADDLESDAESFSDGAIIVKENHSAEGVDIEGLEDQAPVAVDDFDGNLLDLTYMVKVDGYNPDAGDWFWAKQQLDGTIAAAGTPAGCIECHGQVSDNDYVFNAPLAGE